MHARARNLIFLFDRRHAIKHAIKLKLMDKYNKIKNIIGLLSTVDAKLDI